MNIMFFFTLFNAYLSYTHPNYQELHQGLSNQVKDETKVNFITLNNAKYEYRIIKEHISNNSLQIKNELQEKKMKQKRKMDYLFARYQMMVKRVQLQAEKNLYKLEKIRSFTSNHLSTLKREHMEMIEQLIHTDKKINELMKEKKETHLNEMLEKYSEWKKNHEGAEEIINSL